MTSIPPPCSTNVLSPAHVAGRKGGIVQTTSELPSITNVPPRALHCRAYEVPVADRERRERYRPLRGALIRLLEISTESACSVASTS